MPPIPRTELGSELYALMKEPAGATPKAIRERPRLMALSYPRAEAPDLDDPDVQEEAIAEMVRECIDAAAGALDKPTDQRQHTDADNASAARYLLALEQGSTAMPLHQRRKRAAECLRLDDPASIRHQYRSRTRGVAETRETKLMDDLARQMTERENHFLKRNQDEEFAQRADASRFLAVVSDLWDVACQLRWKTASCVGVKRPASRAKYAANADYASLEYFVRFWQLASYSPEYQSYLDQVGKPLDEIVDAFPGVGVALLFSLSPFEPDAVQRFAQAELNLMPEIWPSQIVNELIPQWRQWLASCNCQPPIPRETCRVHQFLISLNIYIRQLERCWDDLRDPCRNPQSYKANANLSPEELMRHYAVLVDIDRTTEGSV